MIPDWVRDVFTLILGGGIIKAVLEHRRDVDKIRNEHDREITKLKNEYESRRQEAVIKAQAVEVDANKVEILERDADIRAHEVAVTVLTGASLKAHELAMSSIAELQTQLDRQKIHIANQDIELKQLRDDNQTFRTLLQECSDVKDQLKREIEDIRSRMNRGE